METSILKSVKKILGISAEYTAFDFDVITHINSTFSVLSQLGVGPVEGFYIEDDSTDWDEFFEEKDLMLIRSYVFLKVKMMFDPPGTSFLLEAMTKQIEEFEWRIQTQREWNLDPVDPLTLEEVIVE